MVYNKRPAEIKQFFYHELFQKELYKDCFSLLRENNKQFEAETKQLVISENYLQKALKC